MLRIDHSPPHGQADMRLQSLDLGVIYDVSGARST